MNKCSESVDKVSKEATLKDVVDRLDRLITLWKLANIDVLKKTKRQIMMDTVSRKILELADGTKEYSALTDEVASAVGKSPRTVRRRITDLVEKGAIRSVRRGNRVYYESTGLYE